MTLGTIPNPQFVALRFPFIDSPAYNDLDGDCLKLYLKLRRFIWRKETGPLGNYYKAGALATSGYLQTWANWLGTSKATASRALKKLEAAGIIKWVFKSSCGKEPNVLVLGRWFQVDVEHVETYFIDTMVTDRDTVSPVQQTVSPAKRTVAPEKQTVAPVQSCNREGIENRIENEYPPAGAGDDPQDPPPDVHREQDPPRCSKCGLLFETGPGAPTTADVCICKGEAALDAAFGERQEREPIEGSGNAAVPVQAGGGHSPAEAVVDDMARYNGLSTGIEALSKSDRRNWVRKVAEIVDPYKATTEQARLAWQGWRVRCAFNGRQCNPFYSSFAGEFGLLLAGVKSGDVTAAILKKEEKETPNENARRSARQTRTEEKRAPEAVERDLEIAQEIHDREQARRAAECAV